MKAFRPFLPAVVTVLGLAMACGYVLAAEQAAAKAASKAEQVKAEQPKAEKPAGEKAEAPKAAEGKKEAVKPEEKKEEATLETRLTELQKAVENATEKTKHAIPKTIDELVQYLPDKEKGLVNPETGGKLLMNEGMASRDDRQILKAEGFVTFYAEKDTPGKGRAVICADSVIKYLNAEELKKALEASKLNKLKAGERTEMIENAEAIRRAQKDARNEERLKAINKAKQGG